MVERRDGSYPLGERTLQAVSREKVMTVLGEIVKSQIVVGGVRRIVYSANLPDIGFENFVKDVASAEKAAIDLNVIQDLKDKETTPKQFIEQESCRFIEDLRAGTYSPKNGSFLDALIKQRAYKKLFDKAKRADRQKAKVFSY